MNKYRIQYGLIDYATFCNNIDHVFSDQADPMAVIENSKSTANFCDDEKDLLLQLLEAIRVEIINKRIMIKPQF